MCYVEKIKCFWNARREQCRRGLGPCPAMYLFTTVRQDSGWKSREVKCQNLPFVITFFSAHHSPNTVNKKANEFVIGTVRLNSTRAVSNHFSSHPFRPRISISSQQSIELTSLPNQQKEPNTPRNINQKRHRISRILERVVHSINDSPDLRF